MRRAKGKSEKAKVKTYKIKQVKTKLRLLPFAFCLFLLCLPVLKFYAQTGGTYRIEKTVVASGGDRSAGGVYSLESTAGQTLAGGRLQGSGFFIQNGFWTFDLVPTASNVSIGGRVLTASGLGIRNIGVRLTAPDGSIRFSSTGSFGYYRFDDVAVGATYVLTVSSRRYIFTNPTRVVTVSDELGNLDFVADE